MKVVILTMLTVTSLYLIAEDTKPVPGSDWNIPDIGMEFVWIKALDNWVGKYEVTNGEYRKYKANHNSKDFQNHSLNGDRQPVVYVNFDDAMEYAKWLTDREQKAGRLPEGYRYRLPSEKEWTTFCQCGDNREYPWGNEWSIKYGNYYDESAKLFMKTIIIGYNDTFPVSCPVEKSGRNDWGLFGVGGNVWECTVKSSTDLSFDAWRGASWHDISSNNHFNHSPGSYTVANNKVSQIGSPGSAASHNGSHSSTPDYLRSTFRYVILATYRDSSGFRLVLSR